MKQIKKLTAMVGMLSAVILGVTGCKESNEDKEKEMLAYMYEKYGVEFQVDWSSETFSNGTFWNCSIKGNTDPNESGKIEVHKLNDEENIYADTYFQILIRDELEERVNHAMEDYGDPYKAYIYESSYIDNKYKSVEQIDQYLEEVGNQYTDYFVHIIVLDKGDKAANEEQTQKILERLRTANIGNAYANIYCMEESVYEERTRSNSSGLSKTMNGKEMYTYRYGGRLY